MSCRNVCGNSRSVAIGASYAAPEERLIAGDFSVSLKSEGGGADIWAVTSGKPRLFHVSLRLLAKQSIVRQIRYSTQELTWVAGRFLLRIAPKQEANMGGKRRMIIGAGFQLHYIAGKLK